MSTIRVSNIKNESTSNGGISVDSFGHVTVDGQQMPTAGALSHRNLVSNGAMRVAQRGTSGVTSSSGAYLSVDRWKCTDGGIGAFTVSQSSTAPDGFANSVKWNCDTADTNISSEIYMEQLIEGQDLQHLNYGTSSAKSITISFWVKSNLTGEFSVWLENFDSARYFTTSGYTINTADTWEYKTITIPGDTGGSGFGNDNDVGMKIRWHLAVRSSYQGTPSGSWSTSASNRSQSSHVNLASNIANEWYLTGVQLEAGDKATPFEHRSYGDELARCERYCQVFEYTGQYHLICQGIIETGATIENIFYLRRPMRTFPSCTLSNIANFRLNDFRGNDEDADAFIGISRGSLSTANLKFRKPTSNMDPGRAGYINAGTSSGATMTFSAEL